MRPPYQISRKSVEWEQRWYMRTYGWTGGRTKNLTPLQSKTELLWRFNFAENNKIYLGI